MFHVFHFKAYIGSCSTRNRVQMFNDRLQVPLESGAVELGMRTLNSQGRLRMRERNKEEREKVWFICEQSGIQHRLQNFSYYSLNS